MVSILSGGEKGLGKTTALLSWAASLSRQGEHTIYLKQGGTVRASPSIPLMVAAKGNVKKLLVYGVPEPDGGHYHRPPDQPARTNWPNWNARVSRAQ